MGLDSNQRSLSTADLQSAGINHSPTYALNFKLVARTGFEPVIFAVKGRCPKPLDERAINLLR